MIKKIVSIILIAALFISVPLFCVGIQSDNHTEKTRSDAESKSRTEMITGMAAAKYRKGYCAETLKALVIILNTNYKLDDSVNTDDKSEFLSEKQFTKKFGGSKYYSVIEKYAQETSSIFLTYKGRKVKIPLAEFSSGFTEPSGEYPFIKHAASPWDATESGSSTAVSLNGINELCKKGLSWRQALKHYTQLRVSK